MKPVTFKKEVIDIPLEDLRIDLAQVRTINVGKDIHELAESIRKTGLQNPIVVCPAKKEGKYEIVSGQRRFLAHKEIGAKTIEARIIDKKLDEFEAKILSFTENIHREGLSRKDELNVCLLLWRRYKNIDYIIQETGLKPTKIRQYLKYNAINPSLQKTVDEGTVDLDAAYRAQLALEVTGNVNSEESVRTAKELQELDPARRKKVTKARKENLDKKIEDIIEDAKAGEELIQLSLTLGKHVQVALRKYAKEEASTQSAVAADLIEQSLISKGLLESE